jgi:hypothetical protein
MMVKAHQPLIEELVRALQSTPKVRSLMTDKKWEEYGLLTPSVKIGIETTASSGRKYLYLGDNTPEGNLVFARWEAGEEYFLIDSALKQWFNQTVYTLAEKKIFQTPSSQISMIQLQFGSEFYEWVKREGVWVWSQPLSMQGKPVNIQISNRLLDQIQNLAVKDFLDPEKAGFFSKTGDYLKVWGKSEEEERLSIGREIPVRDSFYARKDGEKVFFLIDRGRVKTLYDTVKLMASELSYSG